MKYKQNNNDERSPELSGAWFLGQASDFFLFFDFNEPNTRHKGNSR